MQQVSSSYSAGRAQRPYDAYITKLEDNTSQMAKPADVFGPAEYHKTLTVYDARGTAPSTWSSSNNALFQPAVRRSLAKLSPQSNAMIPLWRLRSGHYVLECPPRTPTSSPERPAKASSAAPPEPTIIRAPTRPVKWLAAPVSLPMIAENFGKSPDLSKSAALPSDGTKVECIGRLESYPKKSVTGKGPNDFRVGFSAYLVLKDWTTADTYYVVALAAGFGDLLKSQLSDKHPIMFYSGPHGTLLSWSTAHGRVHTKGFRWFPRDNAGPGRGIYMQSPNPQVGSGAD